MGVGTLTVQPFDTNSLVERLPYAITGLGALLGLVLVVEGVLVATQGVAVPRGYVAGVASSIPFIGGLLFGGYWIQQSHISSERYGRISLWMVAGTIGFTVFIIVVSVAAQQLSLMGVVGTIRWAASVGAGLGLMIGVFDARAV